MGLGFIHPAFLAAGAAVAVPVLIHLLFRQRARPIDIGTLQFLRVASAIARGAGGFGTGAFWS